MPAETMLVARGRLNGIDRQPGADSVRGTSRVPNGELAGPARVNAADDDGRAARRPIPDALAYRPLHFDVGR